jgi:hypothetical protein
MIFKESICRSGWLHRYDLVGQAKEGVLERCVICHKKKSFRIRGGTVNPKNYLAYHMRNALTKDHRKFSKEYPHVR